jgi:hypothetical protein
LKVATEESPVFKEKWQIIQHSMDFRHIPPHKRVFKKNVERMTNEQQARLYNQVKICREWLYKFDEEYNNLNK